ncbi:MAG: zinc-binding dehydrogenase, partial [Chloroflexota bacterium]|nr:zinc-binding dehydrogenase [Chloroflexota bacterium]
QEHRMKTRAAVYLGVGKPLAIDEVELPELQPSQVLVKSMASGICHSQLHQIHDPRQHAPAVLGHEGTGLVLETGDHVEHVTKGDKVILTWLPRNPYPGMARPEPPFFRYKGEDARSGFQYSAWADTTVVDQAFVVKLPDDMPTDVTSIVGCAIMTGAGAVINAARVRIGDSVAVFGLGGVGLAVVQACANSGAYPIIVVDLNDEKLEFAKKFGATHFVNAAKQDPVEAIRAMTNGGVDFSFDAIGAPKTLQQFFPVVRPGISGVSDGGMAVLVGVPQGTTELAMGGLLANRMLRGTSGGSGRPDRDFPMYLRWYKEGKMPLDLLVSRRYRLDEINEGLADLERGAIAGRAIVVFD